MKRLLIVLLALLLLAGACPAWAGEKFDDMSIGGILYYDALQGTDSKFDAGEVFYQQYLEAARKDHPSLVAQWKDVYQALLNDGNFSEYKNGAEQRERSDNWISTTGSGFANSIAAAELKILDIINNGDSYKADDYKYVPKMVKVSPELSGEAQTVFYTYTGYCQTGESAFTDPTAGAYAIIFSNFKVYQVINGEYILNNIQNDENYNLTIGSVDATYASEFSNATINNASASASLASSMSESVTLTTGTSHEFNSSHSITAGGTFKIGKEEWPLGGELSLSYNYTWGEVTGQSYEEGKTKTKEVESTSSISVELPPYTQMVILQQAGTGTMDYTFDYPVAVTYDVDILYFETKEGESFAVSYKQNNDHNATDARSDLNRCANQGADTRGYKYGEHTRAIATQIWKNVPLAPAPTQMNYEVSYTVSELHSIIPLLDLKSVELEEKVNELVLPQGEQMDMSTIGVQGYNEKGIAYFGFDARNGGYWVLLDESGQEVSPVNEIYQTDYFKLARDSITGKTMLTAVKGGGSGYIKYKVKADFYEDVESLVDGPKGQENYINPDTIDNEAVIKISSLATVENFTITASGEIVACAGDGDIELNDPSSPVSAMVLDASGKQFATTGITWEAKELGLTITDNKLILASTIPGTYHIRPVWNGLYPADWLTVTVRPKRELTSIEISDPDGILADQRLSGTDPITITPNNLTVRYIDQYGEVMSSAPDSPTWYVSEDGATQITEVLLNYKVTKAGTYAFFAQWDGVRSNALTLTVYPAATLNRIVIADNPQDKVLGEYILGSGTNTFDLTNLSVSGYDTLGNPYALSGADMTWRVNGTDCAKGQFTVTKEGTYQIDCYHPDTGKSILSNKLTLTVLPATSITRLVIADDPLTPLLKDYLIGSGSDSFDLSQLTVTGYDQYGNPVDTGAISWYVNGAMLSRNTLTVTQVGTYEIYAAYQAGSVMVKSNSLTLNVLTRVTGIQLNAQEVKLAAGDTFKLVATAEPAGETDRYTFTSAKPEVATVDSAGNIKALVQGETLITVAGASGVEAQCLVTVVAAPETVRISPDEMLLGLGDSHQLTPILTPAWSTSVLTYYSSDESVAYVNSSGLVTARALGEAVISVTTHNGRRADCYVKVVNRPNDIEAPQQLVLGVGETADLDAQVAVKTAQAKVLTVLTYDSKDPSVASVSDGGVVTAHKVGQCTIVITSYNGLDRMVNVQVKEAPGKVTLSESKLSLEHGESATLAYTLPEGSAGKVTYRSSKPAYVRVNSDGKITAMKKGSAVITATTYNGKKATCKVTVTGKNPLTLKVKGEVDVLRPDSCATLTPSITAGYTDFTLTITAVKGKQDLGDVTQKFQITKLDSGALEIRKKPDAILKTGGTYTATVAMNKDGRSLVATKTFKVKKGSAKALLSQKTVKLSAGTPQAEIQVTMKDSKLAAISKITSVSQKFSFSYLGDGKVRVSLIGGQVPKKGETLKLKVFLQGHDEAAATVKLQIKLDN